MSKITTSVMIDPELWDEFRKYCFAKGLNVSDYLEELLREEIEKDNAKSD